MSALILKHPRHEVKLQDPRDTFGTDHLIDQGYALPQFLIDTPITASAPPSPDDWIRLERHQRIQTLALEVGSWQQLYRMVRNIASDLGHDVEQARPGDRCLADGCALVNNICVRCGRDNS